MGVDDLTELDSTVLERVLGSRVILENDYIANSYGVAVTIDRLS